MADSNAPCPIKDIRIDFAMVIRKTVTPKPDTKELIANG